MDDLRPANPVFTVVSEPKVADRVASLLLRQIATGVFTPGERLPGERTLAETLGVSRVSVRAALQRLKARGLIAAVQGGGTRVVSTVGDLEAPFSALMKLDRANLQQLAEIRVDLEVWAAQRAADMRTADDLARIDAVLSAMADGGRASRYKADDDLQFHRAVAFAAHSPIYMHLFSVIQETLFSMLAYHRFVLFETEQDDREVLDHHRAIAEAIRSQDASGAADAMGHHLGWVLAHYRQADAELSDATASRAGAPEEGTQKSVRPDGANDRPATARSPTSSSDAVHPGRG